VVEKDFKKETTMSSATQPERIGEISQPHGGSLPALDLQELWFTTLRWEWSSLVLVPAHSSGSAVWIAKALAEIGIPQSRAAKITAQGAVLTATSELVGDLVTQSTIRSMKSSSERWKTGQTIIAIDPVVSNPSGIPVALSADAVLLCVELGKTDIKSARKTVQLIGRERFIGCVIVK
jgi:hypothetical protein